MDAQTFFARYQYDPETDGIGTGGYGAVYRAFDREQGRYRAVKVSQVREDKFSLRREVELTQEITEHPHLARFIGCWRYHVAGTPLDYAVMPFYEHGSLEAVLLKASLSGHDRHRILVGILDGLAHLHTRGAIHRDLKTQNVLMDRQDGIWIPKIADFGMSRMAPEESVSLVSNSAVGYTPSFAAPEQLLGKRIRKNVDLWAFGNIVFRVFTGRLPFEAPPETPPEQRIPEISRRILNENVPEPLLAQIPEPWRRVASACLQKDSSIRPQEVETLLTWLTEQPSKLAPILPEATAPVSQDTWQHTEMAEKKPLPEKERPGPAAVDPPRPVPRKKSGGWFWPVSGMLALGGLVFFLLVQTGTVQLNARPDAGLQMRQILERYHSLILAHNESFAELFADRVTRFYLQKNLTRSAMVKTSRTWWAKYPYENYEVDWDSFRWSRSSEGYFCTYRTRYCKSRSATQPKDCQTVVLTAEFDRELFITALY
jgi:serine/threonine protein kinase